MDLASYLQGADDLLRSRTRFCESEAAIPGCLAQLRPQLCRALGITRFEDFPQPRSPEAERYSGVVADYSGVGPVELQTQASGHAAILVAFLNNTDALLAQNASMRERKDQLEEEVARLRSGIRAAQDRNVDNLGSFDKEARAYEAELAQQRRVERQLREALDGMQSSRDEAARMYSDLAQRYQSLEAALRRSELECDALRDRLRSVHGMNGGVGGAGDLVLAELAGRRGRDSGAMPAIPGVAGKPADRLTDATLARSAFFLNTADQLVEFYDDLGVLLRELADGDGEDAQADPNGILSVLNGAPDYRAELDRAKAQAVARRGIGALQGAAPGPAAGAASLRPSEFMDGLITGVKGRFGLVLSRTQRDAENYQQMISVLQDLMRKQEDTISRLTSGGLAGISAAGRLAGGEAAVSSADGGVESASAPLASPASSAPDRARRGEAGRSAPSTPTPAVVSATISVVSTPAIPGAELRPPIQIVSPISPALQPPPGSALGPAGDLQGERVGRPAGQPGASRLLALAASMDSLKRENTDLRRALEISGVRK